MPFPVLEFVFPYAILLKIGNSKMIIPITFIMLIIYLMLIIHKTLMEADMYPDYHVHTSFSGDSETPAENQIQKALELGMPSVCITDHQDFDFPEEKYGISFEFDTAAYMKEMTALKDRYRGRIDIRIGVELGLQDHLKDQLDAYVKAWEFDYVIGSIHLVRHIDPYYPEYFEGRSSAAAFREYFETVLNNVKTHDDFDALGHLDYIVRYGRKKSQSCFPDGRRHRRNPSGSYQQR